MIMKMQEILRRSLPEYLGSDDKAFPMHHSINECGFAAAQCGKALPYRCGLKNREAAPPLF